MDEPICATSGLDWLAVTFSVLSAAALGAGIELASCKARTAMSPNFPPGPTPPMGNVNGLIKLTSFNKFGNKVATYELHLLTKKLTVYCSNSVLIFAQGLLFVKIPRHELTIAGANLENNTIVANVKKNLLLPGSGANFKNNTIVVKRQEDAKGFFCDHATNNAEVVS